MRHGRLSIVLVMVLVACAPDTTSTGSTPPIATTTVSPSTSATTGSTIADSTVPDSTSPDTTAPDDLAPVRYTAADLPDGAPCTVGSVPDGGQVTFVVGGRLWGVDQRGAMVCLADLRGRDTSWMSWSPDGDEVLVGPDVVLRNDGRFVDTGYFPDNRSLRWSAPTGKALLAPNAQTGHLIWRNAHDSAERIDVSFADRTTAAAYHPAGKHIAAAGTGSDGAGEGVFIATNRGKNVQRIGQIESGEVSDLAFEMNGDSLVFIHRHADGMSEVHRYTFSTAALETIATIPGEQVTGLVASPVDQGALAWSTSHSTQSSLLSVQPTPGAPVVEIGLPESVLQPLAWLPDHRLLFTRANPGEPPGAAVELWTWSAGGLDHVIDDVSAASARTMHGPYLELNIIQGSGFG